MQSRISLSNFLVFLLIASLSLISSYDLDMRWAPLIIESNKDTLLNCSPRKHLQIISSWHYFDPPPFIAGLNGSKNLLPECNQHKNVTQPIMSLCDKKRSCKLNTNQFASPPSCHRNIIQVEYQCLPDRNAQIKESICADSYIESKCPDQVINVNLAVALSSNHPEYAPNCPAIELKQHYSTSGQDCNNFYNNVTQHFKTLCNGKSSCQVFPYTEIINGCKMNNLYLSYSCIPRISLAKDSFDSGKILKQTPNKFNPKKINAEYTNFNGRDGNHGFNADRGLENSLRKNHKGSDNEMVDEDDAGEGGMRKSDETNKTLVLYSIIASIVGVILIILLITTVTLLCRKNHDIKSSSMFHPNVGNMPGLKSSLNFDYNKGIKAINKPQQTAGIFPPPMASYQPCNSCQSSNSPYNLTSCMEGCRSVSNSCLSQNDCCNLGSSSMNKQQDMYVFHDNPIIGKNGSIVSPSMVNTPGQLRNNKNMMNDNFNSSLVSSTGPMNQISCNNVHYNGSTCLAYDPEKSSSGMGSSLPRGNSSLISHQKCNYNCPDDNANFLSIQYNPSSFTDLQGTRQGSAGSDCSRSPPICYPPFPSYFNDGHHTAVHNQRNVESFIKGVMNEYPSHNTHSHDSLPVFEPPEIFKSSIFNKPSPLINHTSTEEDLSSFRSRAIEDSNDSLIDNNPGINKPLLLPPTMGPLKIDTEHNSVQL